MWVLVRRVVIPNLTVGSLFRIKHEGRYSENKFRSIIPKGQYSEPRIRGLIPRIGFYLKKHSQWSRKKGKRRIECVEEENKHIFKNEKRKEKEKENENGK